MCVKFVTGKGRIPYSPDIHTNVQLSMSHKGRKRYLNRKTKNRNFELLKVWRLKGYRGMLTELFAVHTLPYPTERFGGNSEIGRDHILWEALKELRIGIGKVIVSFLCRHAECRVYPLLGRYRQLSVHRFN